MVDTVIAASGDVRVIIVYYFMIVLSDLIWFVQFLDIMRLGFFRDVVSFVYSSVIINRRSRTISSVFCFYYDVSNSFVSVVVFICYWWEE